MGPQALKTNEFDLLSIGEIKHLKVEMESFQPMNEFESKLVQGVLLRDGYTPDQKTASITNDLGQNISGPDKLYEYGGLSNEEDMQFVTPDG